LEYDSATNPPHDERHRDCRRTDCAVRKAAEGWTLLRPGGGATARVWDSESGQEPLRGAGRIAKLRDAAQGTASQSLRGHQEGVTSVAFSGDRRTALTRQPRRLGDRAAIDGVATVPEECRRRASGEAAAFVAPRIIFAGRPRFFAHPLPTRRPHR